MATAIQQQEGVVNHINSTLTQMQKLINGLAPDPREWVYRGNCHDLGAMIGACVCGHPIRFEFMVHRDRDGASAILGSVCIDHYALISPSAAEWMREDMRRMMEKIKADRKAAEEARLQVEVDAQLAIYTEMREQLLDLAEKYRALKPTDRYPLPYELWIALYGGRGRFPVQCEQEYQSTKLYLRWYKKHIEKLQDVLTRNALSRQ